MTSLQLREVRDARPFRPFTIHFADGRRFRVPREDYVSISPNGRTVMIFKDLAFQRLDLSLVTELKVDPGSNGNAAGA